MRENNQEREQTSVLALYDRRQKYQPMPDNEELSFIRLNEIGNSQRLVRRYGQDMAFVEQFGWLCWNGKFWDRERGNSLAMAYAMRTAEALYDEADSIKGDEADKEEWESCFKGYRAWAKSSSSRAGVNAMLALAKPELEVEADDFDQSDFMIALSNGKLFLDKKRQQGKTVGVKVGLAAHERADLNTKICDVDYDADAQCPRWRQFVSEILPDKDVAVYFQKSMGYSFIGDRSLQIATFLYGNGSDGKSTAMEVMAKIAGSYAKTVGINTFLYDRNAGGSGPTPDIAGLPGVRLVRLSEPNIGVRLDEERIKIFTGGEDVTARKLQRDFFEFRPRCHLVFSLNHKPTISGKDFGIRRRIRIIPFEQSFGKPDASGFIKNPKKDQKELIAALLQERSGILNWLIDGIRMALVDGMDEPEPVMSAKAKWFEENDPIGNFLRDCCKIYSDKTMAGEENSKLYGVYQDWCTETLENEKSKNAFGKRLADLGHLTKRANSKYLRLGLMLKEDAVFGDKDKDEGLWK